MGLPLSPSRQASAPMSIKQHLSADGSAIHWCLMLEPLFRCNLACAGCGKIDYPDEILNQRLIVSDECMDAIDECGAPAVSIAGGEPLLHREMAADRGRLYRAQEQVRHPLHQRPAAEPRRSTNTSRMPLFHLVHPSGWRQGHARQIRLPRRYVYEKAIAAIKLAKSKGFPHPDQLHLV